jgi:glycosyltransferase involved in cell wall biosynthesis
LIKSLAAIIDREKIQIVHGVMLFATLIAWLASRRSGGRPPVIAAVHTTINRGFKQELQERLIYRRLLRRLPTIVFVCNYQMDHWMSKYPDLRSLSTVVHNGVEPASFCRDEFTDSARQLREGLGIPDDAFVFACVAAFRPEKGHKLLIEAFSRIQGNAYLIFAGEGELRAGMEDYAVALGLKTRTRFLGSIPDTRPLIAASNATVLASTAVETFSMAMLESMAIGVPMIAPRIGGLPEAVVDGKTGLLFALASCMQSVVDRPSRAEKMGNFAAQKVADEFTLEKMLIGSEKLMRDTLIAIGKADNSNH